MSKDTGFPDAAKLAAQAVHMDAIRVLGEAVNAAEPDPDLVVKVYNATKDVAQAVPEKKTDPRAGLPVVSITFVGGRTQVAAASAPLEVVQEVQPAPQPELPAAETQLALPAPKPREYAMTPVDMTLDLDALLEGLK